MLRAVHAKMKKECWQRASPQLLYWVFRLNGVVGSRARQTVAMTPLKQIANCLENTTDFVIAYDDVVGTVGTAAALQAICCTFVFAYYRSHSTPTTVFDASEATQVNPQMQCDGHMWLLINRDSLA